MKENALNHVIVKGEKKLTLAKTNAGKKTHTSRHHHLCG